MRHSILLVDSNPDTAEMYAVGLRLAGFEPAVAATVSDACTQMRRHPPDALVAELIDASAESWRLLHVVQADAATRGVPVFVLTSWLGGRLADAARDAGCTALLGTPCLPETLAAFLRSVLRSPSPAERRAAAADRRAPLAHGGAERAPLVPFGPTIHRRARRGATAHCRTPRADP